MLWNALEEEVFVIRKCDKDAPTTKKMKVAPRSGDVSPAECKHLEVGDTALDCDNGSIEPSLPSPSPSTEDKIVVVNPLQSTLLPRCILLKYQHEEEKAWRHLREVSLGNNLWHLKTLDMIGTAVVRIHCEECAFDFGGSSGDHNTHGMQNLFNNFKKKAPLLCEAYSKPLSTLGFSLQ
jgi:hypothetical protein